MLIEDSLSKTNKKNVQDTIEYFIEIDQSNRKNNHVNFKQDSIVQEQFLNYLQTVGLPNIQQYGDFFLLINLHVINKNIFNKFESFFIEQLKKGNIYPYHYSSMVDRFLLENNEETMYNSYLYSNISSKKLEREIKKNRKSIGLSLYFKGSCIAPL